MVLNKNSLLSKLKFIEINRNQEMTTKAQILISTNNLASVCFEFSETNTCTILGTKQWTGRPQQVGSIQHYKGQGPSDQMSHGELNN